MNELGLFAGAGGGLLASQHLLGHRTVCYVERDPYCIDVLKARIRDGVLDDAPIWDDVRTFDGRPWRGKVDIVSAGFPCQPFSIAGAQKADLDERNMWPETVRIIREVQSEWCFLENVPGLLFAGHGYFGTILRDLAESGFVVAWKVLSAAEVGACHLRKRLWIVGRNADCGDERAQLRVRGGEGADVRGIGNVADTERCRCERTRPGIMGQDAGANGRDDTGGCSDVVHADLRRCARSNQTQATESDVYVKAGHTPSVWWDTEPAVGRVADGVAHRVDRRRAIGNGQVPPVAATAWRLLTTESTEEP